eukprot:Em0021g103a
MRNHWPVRQPDDQLPVIYSKRTTEAQRSDSRSNSSKNNPPTSNQQWLFEQQPGGSYYIISRLNGKLLDTSGGGRQLGEEVVLSDRYAGENQRWHRKGVYIVSAKNGNVLDICGASRAPNAQIIAWCKKSVFNSINQQFELEKAFVSTYIKSHLNGFVLGIENSCRDEAAPVSACPASNPSTSNQLWHVDVQHNGSFLIVSEMNEKVLECGNGASGANLRVCNLKDPENRHKQCWRLEGYIIVSALSNCVISIQDRNVWPQASVHVQARCAPVAEWQKFEFVEVASAAPVPSQAAPQALPQALPQAPPQAPPQIPPLVQSSTSLPSQAPPQAPSLVQSPISLPPQAPPQNLPLRAWPVDRGGGGETRRLPSKPQGSHGMKYSLISRDWIADCIEIMHEAYSAIGAFLYGGTILPGHCPGKTERQDAQSVMEAIGSYGAGIMDIEELHSVECCALPGSGACGGMFTANTMSASVEALGMSLPGLENAIAVMYALGGSTNGILHLLALAHEANVDLSIDDFNRIGDGIPLLANLKPHGKYHMADLDVIEDCLYGGEEGGRGGLLHGDCLTVTGKTVAENLHITPTPSQLQQDVVFPLERPMSAPGRHIIVLKGSLAPESAVLN